MVLPPATSTSPGLQITSAEVKLPSAESQLVKYSNQTSHVVSIFSHASSTYFAACPPQCCVANMSRIITFHREKHTKQENRQHGMKPLRLLFSLVCGTRRPSWIWWMFSPFLRSSLPVSRDGWARIRPPPTWGSQIHGTPWVRVTFHQQVE